MTFAPIQNRDRARQLVSFEGMELGERMWPTDIDAVIELRGRAWVVFEVKHGRKQVPRGQRLALERFVRDAFKAGKLAVAAVVEHWVDDPSEDVRLADCNVREVFVGGERAWRSPNRRLTARELTDAYIGYAMRRCA